MRTHTRLDNIFFWKLQECHDFLYHNLISLSKKKQHKFPFFVLFISVTYSWDIFQFIEVIGLKIEKHSD